MTWFAKTRPRYPMQMRRQESGRSPDGRACGLSVGLAIFHPLPRLARIRSLQRIGMGQREPRLGRGIVLVRQRHQSILVLASATWVLAFVDVVALLAQGMVRNGEGVADAPDKFGSRVPSSVGEHQLEALGFGRSMLWHRVVIRDEYARQPSRAPPPGAAVCASDCWSRPADCPRVECGRIA